MAGQLESIKKLSAQGVEVFIKNTKAVDKDKKNNPQELTLAQKDEKNAHEVELIIKNPKAKLEEKIIMRENPKAILKEKIIIRENPKALLEEKIIMREIPIVQKPSILIEDLNDEKIGERMREIPIVQKPSIIIEDLNDEKRGERMREIPIVQKPSVEKPLIEDLNDDIAIVGENVQENSYKRKKNFTCAKTISIPTIQILDDSNESSDDEIPDEYANVCGVDVNLKTLLQMEDVRKHLEPFIEKEEKSYSSSESDTEEIEVIIDRKLLSVGGLDKRLLICQACPPMLDSEVKKQFIVKECLEVDEKSKLIKDVEILLSDPSDDESNDSNKLENENLYTSSKKVLQPHKSISSSKSKYNINNPIPTLENSASECQLILEKGSHSKQETSLPKTISKQQKPQEKKAYMKNLDLHETSKNNDEIILENLSSVDLSTDAKIMSFVNQLCESEDDISTQNIDPMINSSMNESDDWYYLNIADKKLFSRKNLKTPKKTLKSPIKVSPKSKILKTKNEISPTKTTTYDLENKLMKDEISILSENELPVNKKIEFPSNIESLKEVKDLDVQTPKINDKLSDSEDNPILKITDDILPVETVAPKRRGRKRKNDHKVDIFGKICIQDNVANVNSKKLKIAASSAKVNILNSQIQTTLAETVKSFYSTDQLHPIKQEISEVIHKEYVGDLDNVDDSTNSSDTAQYDTNNLLSVFRKESVEDFYKSKNTQRKKRKRKSLKRRLNHVKYANLDRTQWQFLSKADLNKNNHNQMVQSKSLPSPIVGRCRYCERSYIRFGRLKSHELVCGKLIESKGETDLDCAICNLKFKDKDTFKIHLSNHIFDTPEDLNRNLNKNMCTQKTSHVSDVKSRLRHRRKSGSESTKVENRQIKKIKRRKRKLKNRKKMEMIMLNIRSSPRRPLNFQINHSSRLESSSLENRHNNSTTNSKKYLISLRGRKARMHKYKKSNSAQKSAKQLKKPPIFLDLSGKKFLVHPEQSDNSRSGVLNYCLVHCHICDIDSYAQRMYTRCHFCKAGLNYYCAFCEKKYYSFALLRAHVLNNIYRACPSNRCPNCNRSHFTSACGFKKHKKNCKGEFFMDKELLVEIGRCEFQAELFEGQRRALTLHCTNCNITKYALKEEKNCNKCQSLLLYKCVICDKLLESESSFRSHVLDTHIIGNDIVDNNEKGNVDDEIDDIDEINEDENKDEDICLKNDSDELNLNKETSAIEEPVSNLNLKNIDSVDLLKIDSDILPTTNNYTSSILKEKTKTATTMYNQSESEDEFIENDQSEIQISSMELFEIIGINNIESEVNTPKISAVEKCVNNMNSTLSISEKTSIIEPNPFVTSDDDSSDEDQFKENVNTILKDLSENDFGDNDQSNKKHETHNEESCLKNIFYLANELSKMKSSTDIDNLKKNVQDSNESVKQLCIKNDKSHQQVSNCTESLKKLGDVPEISDSSLKNSAIENDLSNLKNFDVSQEKNNYNAEKINIPPTESDKVPASENDDSPASFSPLNNNDQYIKMTHLFAEKLFISNGYKNDCQSTNNQNTIEDDDSVKETNIVGNDKSLQRENFSEKDIKCSDNAENDHLLGATNGFTENSSNETSNVKLFDNNSSLNAVRIDENINESKENSSDLSESNYCNKKEETINGS